ncbi:hypothetical protein HGRIS_009933 [Hohenbuehelia grisea]|uniref:C2H2-type domain-containing protein n=1 Tax=Hohenbuehelia grisea TaxID=104357 RepID=A0ABR3J357_9AGAR
MPFAKPRRSHKAHIANNSPRLFNLPYHSLLPQFPGRRTHLLDAQTQPNYFQCNSHHSPASRIGLGIRLDGLALPKDPYQPFVAIDQHLVHDHHPGHSSQQNTAISTLRTHSDHPEVTWEDILVDDAFAYTRPQDDPFGREAYQDTDVQPWNLDETIPDRFLLCSPRLAAQTPPGGFLDSTSKSASSLSGMAMSISGPLLDFSTPEMASFVVDASLRLATDEFQGSSIGVNPSAVSMLDFDSQWPAPKCSEPPAPEPQVTADSFTNTVLSVIQRFSASQPPHAAITSELPERVCEASAPPTAPSFEPCPVKRCNEDTSVVSVKLEEIDADFSDVWPKPDPYHVDSMNGLSFSSNASLFPQACIGKQEPLELKPVIFPENALEDAKWFGLVPQHKPSAARRPTVSSTRKRHPVPPTINVGTPVIDGHFGVDVTELLARAAKFKERNPGVDVHRSWLEMFAGRLSNTGESIDVYRCYVSGCTHSNRRRDHILVHISGHINERPFQCSHCAKRFLRKNECKRHELCHSGFKPYTCLLCPGQVSSFVRQDMLRRHLHLRHQINWKSNPQPFVASELGLYEEPPLKRMRLE